MPPRSRLEWMLERKATLTGPLKYVAFPEQVILMTGCPDLGWMEARLIIGTDVFPIVFSDVYTPISDFAVWLEKLVLAEPPDAIWTDDEDQEHFFHVTATDDPAKLVFEYMRGRSSGDGVYRRACVGRDALILEFYRVLNSLNSLKFDERLDPFSEEEPSDALPGNVSFDFYRHTDEVIRLDLSKAEDYLIDKGLLPFAD